MKKEYKSDVQKDVKLVALWVVMLDSEMVERWESMMVASLGTMKVLKQVVHLVGLKVETMVQQ